MTLQNSWGKLPQMMDPNVPFGAVKKVTSRQFSHLQTVTAEYITCFMPLPALLRLMMDPSRMVEGTG